MWSPCNQCTAHRRPACHRIGSSQAAAWAERAARQMPATPGRRDRRGLIGERGREVKEFIDKSWSRRASRAVWSWPVRQTTSRSLRLHGSCSPRRSRSIPGSGTERSAHHDSLTRFAQAQRESGLRSVRRPPPRLSAVGLRAPAQLVERAGNASPDVRLDHGVLHRTD